MIFYYKATAQDGREESGTIDAQNQDSAILALQRKGLLVLDISNKEKSSPFDINIKFFQRVKPADVVILSRQLSTLFEAKVPVLDSFRLLSEQSENELLRSVLAQVTEDIRGGLSISKAMNKHPDVFSNFYVNMIMSGEETGKLSETLTYLADYLERQYELASKAKSAMVYPAFIILAFFGVMTLMMVVVIPKLSQIILETGQEIPLYTQIVIGTSNFMVKYGIFLAVAMVFGILSLWRYTLTPTGLIKMDRLRLATPFVGDLFRKLYLSRMADNLDTMVSSGISMLKALEVTGKVVNSPTFKQIIDESIEKVRGGGSLSDALSVYPEIPKIMVQMIKIGENTGKLGFVLRTVSRFYRREVEGAIQTLVSLIEPVMIILLGAGVGLLLTSVLLPIYNIAGSL
jgi:type IV pilus assembly protein PilC